MDECGQATWRAELSSYGCLRHLTGNRGVCPFRYQGQYEDVETGLYYNRFRYFDPTTGGCKLPLKVGQSKLEDGGIFDLLP